MTKMSLTISQSVCFLFSLCVVRSGAEILEAGSDNGAKQSEMSLPDGSKWEPPAFCNGLDCPIFKEVNKTKNYELREYVKSRWVSTRMENIDYDEAVSMMFGKLFKYISGENEKKEKIAMTAPVIVRVIPGQGPACENNFTLSFYVAAGEKDPPAPTNKDVYLSELPTERIYVRSFGGRAHKNSWLKEADQLTVDLHRDKKNFETGFFYTAGYDSPFKLFNRHNEIWFIAKD